MLITFESKVGRVTMFGDVALHLLRMMGNTGTVPGALLARDIPVALEKLEQGLAAEAAPVSTSSEDEEEERQEKPNLRVRAFPLIGLLKDSLKHGCDLLWEQEGKAPLKF
ncbi:MULTISPECIES: DUF1840 domain-containing protein [Methylococcus]|jgi:hypothetical protein|uniref:DUF1840 domain-containing protein n=2 Tax=Methylococcus capsulatus TaxID=414 RepID=Q60CM8_METCA|nr:DUF1840 domain-containing protein [Methylococcus capsulatus]AAU90764.1 conserved hypothetical protein [Methylococcus capsulatus str. Bath]QXP89360.1 DUF1840 domain-containing protein [Methylococcus capsulatus]CAI8786568.1 conserved protein of unknown function [Methylococcus capsulatus]